MLILDGGLGRQLQRIGAPFRQPEWSALALIESPAQVRRVHDDFIAAGADIITTNSYALVPFHIGESRFERRGGDLMDLAGTLARAAARDAGRPVRVAAGIPPLFGSYAPADFDAGRAAAMHAMFAARLLPHCDIVLAETLASTAEIASFVEAFAATALPLWVSLTLDDHDAVAGTPKLRSGEPLARALELLSGLGPAAVLFNCSQPEVMADGVELARAALPDGIDIGVYANAFPPIATNTAAANETLADIRTDLTPDRYRGFAEEWLRRGASIIGGCCGVGPEHIAALYDLKAGHAPSPPGKRDTP